MWKKYQTYLIGAATILCVAMFFCRLATIIGPGGEELGIMYYEKLPYAVMLIMLLTAGISAIFCHKFPMLQARVCMLSALLALGFQIWLGIDFISYRHEMIFNISGVFPIACVILDVLASRAAMVDQLTLSAIGSARKAKKSRRKKNQ